MIKLRYTINGSRFTRGYSKAMWRHAINRARALRKHGIDVEIRRTK